VAALEVGVPCPPLGAGGAVTYLSRSRLPLLFASAGQAEPEQQQSSPSHTRQQSHRHLRASSSGRQRLGLIFNLGVGQFNLFGLLLAFGHQGRFYLCRLALDTGRYSR